MASPRILVAACSIAALLLSVGQVAQAGGTQESVALTVRTSAVTVAADALPLGAAQNVTLSVPGGVSRLQGSVTGSPALAARVRLTVVRVSDGATLFVGSLASFRSLPVAAGDALRVGVQRLGGYRGLRAGAHLSFAA